MGIKVPIFQILVALIVLAWVVGVIAAIVAIVRTCKKSKVKHNRLAIGWYVISVFCVLIMLISWVFNMGWYRVILTWFMFPVIHSIIFLWVNFKVASEISRSNGLNKPLLVSCITYLLPYLIFPDGGDIGGMYLFFGLIRNDTVANIMSMIAPIILIIHVAVLIWSYLLFRRNKTNK